MQQAIGYRFGFLLLFQCCMLSHDHFCCGPWQALIGTFSAFAFVGRMRRGVAQAPYCCYSCMYACRSPILSRHSFSCSRTTRALCSLCFPPRLCGVMLYFFKHHVSTHPRYFPWLNKMYLCCCRSCLWLFTAIPVDAGFLCAKAMAVLAQSREDYLDDDGDDNNEHEVGGKNGGETGKKRGTGAKR